MLNAFPQARHVFFSSDDGGALHIGLDLMWASSFARVRYDKPHTVHGNAMRCLGSSPPTADRLHAGELSRCTLNNRLVENILPQDVHVLGLATASLMPEQAGVEEMCCRSSYDDPNVNLQMRHLVDLHTGDDNKCADSSALDLKRSLQPLHCIDGKCTTRVGISGLQPIC